MQRGIMVLVLQLLICLAVAGLGILAVTRPKRLQLFMNENFHLLPVVGSGAGITRIFVRLFGIFLLYYSYALLREYRNELLWIGRMIGWSQAASPV